VDGVVMGVQECELAILVLLGFTGGEAFGRCWGTPVERMGPTTNGWWAAPSALSIVKASFLVLLGFTRPSLGVA